MKMAGLQIARIVAVAFAIGVGAWIVVTAQQDAGDEPAGPPAPDATSEDSGSGDEPVFMPSSKSTIGIGGGVGGAFENRGAEAEARKPSAKKATNKSADKDPGFLPSSKSLPLGLDDE